MRAVGIVLLDPASDRPLRFLHDALLRRPDFFFLQAAMEPFDIGVALRVSRATIGVTLGILDRRSYGAGGINSATIAITAPTIAVLLDPAPIHPGFLGGRVPSRPTLSQGIQKSALPSK
jgi:hypothetical protein